MRTAVSSTPGRFLSWLLRVVPFAVAGLLFAGVPAGASGQVSVWTWRYDNSRVGVDAQEYQLTPGVVNPATFGRLFSQSVDGDIYAQPLYLPNVAIPGKGVHDVVFVATENDSVYAFDADDDRGVDAAPLWQDSFTDPPMGIRAVTEGELQCGDIPNETGITGTPVIDTSTGTLYVVSKTWENGQIVQRLHALDVATGAEKDGGPVLIQASVTGQGVDTDNGVVSFNPAMENQRPGLLLDQGVVYITWGSTCDHTPWHGWVMAYDAATLRQIAVFNTTPDGNGGGFWQAGAAPAADSQGNVYLANANGTLDANLGGRDFASAILRLQLQGNQLAPSDDFIPFNAAFMNTTNEEPSSGVLLLPGSAGGSQPLALTASKLGTLYLLDRNQFGGFHSGSDSQIVQEVVEASPGITSTPAWWNGRLYLIGGGEFTGPDVLKVFSLQGGRMSDSPVMTGAQTFGFPGASPVISTDGGNDGIVWAVRTDGWKTGAPAVLYAWDADTLKLLYSSDQNGGQDSPGAAVKFAVPVVANGKVYVGAHDQLSVYGVRVADFSLSLSPANQNIDTGAGASLTIASNSSNPLSLQCSLPSSQCQISPATLAPGETATLTLSPGALATGTHSVSVEADNSVYQHRQTATVDVQDFSLWLPQNQGSIQSGNTLTTSIRLTSDGGYNSPAQLRCDQPPAGVQCSFDPETVDSNSPASTWTIQTSSGLASGDYSLTALAAHGGLHHASRFSLHVVDYQLQASPASVTASPAGVPVLTIAATGPAGSTETIQLGCGLTNGIVCTFSPATIHPGESSQLTLSGLNGQTPGVIGLQVTGTVSAGSTPITVQAPITVNIQDYQLASSAPAQAITRGDESAQFTITAQSDDGLAGPIALTCAVAAPATCAFSPAAVKPGERSTLTVQNLAKITAESLRVAVQGSWQNDVHQLALAVQFRDFQLTVAQVKPTIQPGSNSLSLPISAAAINGFSSPIRLSCKSSVVQCAFAPETVSPGQSSTATFTGLDAVTGNSVQLEVDGSSSTLTRALPLQILIGDFGLSGAKYAGQVAAGQSAEFPLTLTSFNSFAGPVQFGCEGAPANATCAVEPATVTIAGDGTAAVHLVVTTMARSGALPASGSGPFPPLSRLNGMVAGMALFGLLLLLTVGRVRPRWRPVVLAVTLLMAEVACGGPAPLRGTPAGTSTLTITASSGKVQHLLPFELTVK